MLDSSAIHILEWLYRESRPDGGSSFTCFGVASGLIDAESIALNIGGATFRFPDINHPRSSMNQPAIRDFTVTRPSGFAALASDWRSPAKAGQLPRVEGVAYTVDSQRITTDAGGWRGGGVFAR